MIAVSLAQLQATEPISLKMDRPVAFMELCASPVRMAEQARQSNQRQLVS